VEVQFVLYALQVACKLPHCGIESEEEEHMLRLNRVGSVLLLGAAMVGGTMLSFAHEEMTGVISDAACGAGAHKGADAKRCANACAGNGGYVLVVGDKVYKLEGTLEGIQEVAGGKARLTGDVDASAMTITRVRRVFKAE
jgi:hypothetical protein